MFFASRRPRSFACDLSLRLALVSARFRALASLLRPLSVRRLASFRVLSASLFFRPSQRACYMPSLAANPRSTRASGRLSPVGCASLLSSALALSSRRCRYHCRYHRKKKLHRSRTEHEAKTGQKKVRKASQATPTRNPPITIHIIHLVSAIPPPLLLFYSLFQKFFLTKNSCSIISTQR